MPIIITGAAGFIGFHLSRRLLDYGFEVVGLDSIDPYYDPSLKHARLAQLKDSKFTFIKGDIADQTFISNIFARQDNITHIFHLAAQAGVRYSMENPHAYATSNLIGHLNILEAARHLSNLKHFVYASSSSVYGLNKQVPFSEHHVVATPASFYAATKLANEHMSHAYAHLYGVKATGVRFFTVYGPWGRPDMAIYGFAQKMLQGQPITLYQEPGQEMRRDFTHVADVIDGLVGIMNLPPEKHRVLNLGFGRTEPVTKMISLLEHNLGVKALIEHTPKPAADVVETWADISAIKQLCGYTPSRSLDIGIPDFTKWFTNFQKG
jgi:UDP-glucuronate 4-epimerase